MKYKKLLSLLAGVVFINASITAANAATVKFASPMMPANVQPGGSLMLNLVGEDFATAPDAGGFGLSWDPAVLQYVGTTVSNPPWDTETINATSAPAGVLDFVFIGKSTSGAGSDFDIALITFNVIGAIGDTSVLDLGDVFGGVWAAPGGTMLMDVGYEDGQVYVVPIPAAFWLMLSAIGILGIGARRSKTA